LSYFDITTKPKTDIEILQKIRVEQKSVYALEHMLGYYINELEELRPHKKNIEFIAKSNYENYPDLVELSYWSERIQNISASIQKNKKKLIEVYDRLYSQIIFKMIEGEKLSSLDIFFYYCKEYMEKLKSGEITFRELVESYDWESQQFSELN